MDIKLGYYYRDINIPKGLKRASIIGFTSSPFFVSKVFTHSIEFISSPFWVGIEIGT
ncbi:hypothetical protein GCM10028868_30940 [Virgibacillus kimchii]